MITKKLIATAVLWGGIGIAFTYFVCVLPTGIHQALAVVSIIVSFAAGAHFGQQEEAESWTYSAKLGSSRYHEGTFYYIAASNDEQQKRTLSACLGMLPPNWVNTEALREEGRRLEREDVLAVAHDEALALALKGREADAAAIQALCKLLMEQRHVGISTLPDGQPEEVAL